MRAWPIILPRTRSIIVGFNRKYPRRRQSQQFLPACGRPPPVLWRANKRTDRGARASYQHSRGNMRAEHTCMHVGKSQPRRIHSTHTIVHAKGKRTDTPDKPSLAAAISFLMMRLPRFVRRRGSIGTSSSFSVAAVDAIAFWYVRRRWR